jgi:hypothetical protein
VEGPPKDGRPREFPAVYDRAVALRGRLDAAQRKVAGAKEGQLEPPFPDIHASAVAVDQRLAIAHRKSTGAERGKPEPEFPDLQNPPVATQKKPKKPAAAPPSPPAG